MQLRPLDVAAGPLGLDHVGSRAGAAAATARDRPVDEQLLVTDEQHQPRQRFGQVVEVGGPRGHDVILAPGPDSRSGALARPPDDPPAPHRAAGP